MSKSVPSNVLAIVTMIVTCFMIMPIIASAETAETGNSSRAPVEVGSTFTFPEGANLYGFGVGMSVVPDVGFAVYYSVTVPEEADHLLHGFGGGIRLDVLSARRGIPFDLSFLGSVNLTKANGLPDDVAMDGQAYTLGLSIGRFLRVADNLGITTTIMPSWTFTRSKLSVSGFDDREEKDTLNYWGGSISFIFRHYLTLTPFVTIGDNLTAPGLSIVIYNRIVLKGGMVDYYDLQSPSFSIGMIL